MGCRDLQSGKMSRKAPITMFQLVDHRILVFFNTSCTYPVISGLRYYLTLHLIPSDFWNLQMWQDVPVCAFGIRKTLIEQGLLSFLGHLRCPFIKYLSKSVSNGLILLCACLAMIQNVFWSFALPKMMMPLL